MGTTPQNSVHAGGPGNPLAELTSVTDAGRVIAPLLACGGVAEDGSNVVGVFVFVATDDGMIHETGNIPPELMAMQLLTSVGMPSLPSPDSDPFRGL